VKTVKTAVLLLILALVLVPSAMAQTAAEAQGRTAVPYPTAETPRAVDLGAMTAQPGKAAPMSVTVALSLRNLSEAEELMKEVATPGTAQYHKFLTSDQFVERFAPTAAEVTSAIAALAKYGLVAQRATATTLTVTGMPKNMERAFGVSLHTYQVAAHGNAPAYTYHAPLSHPTIPSELAGHVSGVAGLDSRPALRPLSQAILKTLPTPQPTVPPATGNPPQHFTVTDFASYYNVNPLYEKGITGKGRTLGIVTLANLTPSDAFAYWAALGLTVNPGRLTIVTVDGGPGAPSDVSGSLESTLDTEQSGGIAPGANIIVYLAPNTNQGFVDGFATAVDGNNADSISVSWGFWEWYQNLENSPVTDPTTGKTVGITQAFHELFTRAAIQGQSLYAASGDGGAYDVNNDLGCFGGYSASNPFSCNTTLTVDNPASDSAITAAGGTTRPVVLGFCLTSSCPPYYIVDVPQERVWGWDYFNGLCSTLMLTISECGFFPGGSGGGVSIIFPIPVYQWFIPGVQLSQPGQVWQINPFLASLYGITNTYYALPAYYPGRNVPDVSFDADPYTGYVVYYTSEPSGVFGIEPGWGGTSFVAPQLNGVTALLGQDLDSRLGLLNYPLYFFALTGQAYHGPDAPLNIISTGDNWFYTGRNGYAPAAGLGTMNVANFDRKLRDPF